MPTDPVRAEHDAVLSSLSTRESTRHFAHAAVSMLISVALSGTAAKLWWDYWGTNPEYALSFAGLTALCLLYAAIRLTFARRANGRERVQLVRLRELRKALGVDAPASLTQQVS
jgi:uncharacterized membrane protein YcjF (UPF0283 family)